MDGKTRLTRRGASSDAPFCLRGNPVDYVTLAVLLGGLALFVLYPIACILLRSVQGDSGLTLEHYRTVWNQYRQSLWNSVWVGAVSAVLCTVFSVAAALCLASVKGWRRSLLMGILLLAMVSPPFVSSLAYIQLYGRRGWITFRLLGLRLDPYNCWGVIIMQSISFVPTNALFLLGMLAKLDADSIRTARDLGAKPGHILRDIVIPLLWPGICVSLLLSFIRSLADFGTPIIIGGRFNTLASDIYLQLTGYSNLEKASAMNIFLLLPAMAAFFYYRRQMARANQGGSARGAQNYPALRLRSSGSLGWLVIACGTVFFVMMSLQYIVIFITGFLTRAGGSYALTTKNLENLLRLNGQMFVRSILYALTVAFVGTLFAMLFAYYMDRKKVRGHHFFDSLASFPYLIPGTCWGIGYILAFNSEPLRLTGTAIIVLVNMMFKQLPTTTKICSAALTQIHPSLERAARDMGGGQGAVIRDVILPNMKQAFFSCFTYHFSSSMTSAGAIIFLIDPSRKLAVFQLFDAVYSGEYATASLIASLIIVMVVVAEGAMYLITGKERRSRVS